MNERFNKLFVIQCQFKGTETLIKYFWDFNTLTLIGYGISLGRWLR